MSSGKKNEWKVEMIRLSEIFRLLSVLEIRHFISRAALLVNVKQRISEGDIPCDRRCSTLFVSTLVFPVPAPARTKTSWLVEVTAFSCSGLRSV